MKYFVYAINKKLETIVAALSCPDEKTGKQAYVMACQQMERDLDDSVCGVVHINDRTTIKVHDNDSHDTVRLHFWINDFETAAKQTRERLCEGKTGGGYDDLMQSVGVAMEELTGNIDPVMHSCATTETVPMTEEEVRALVRTEVMPVIEHDVENVLSGILCNTTGKPVTILQSVSSVADQTQSACEQEHPKSAAEAQDDSIPLLEKPNETIISGIAPAACRDIAVALEREKREVEVLSIPQSEKELEKVHVELLAEKGYKPLEIALLIYPDAGDTIIRQKSQWISNHIGALKKAG